jgi:hypothetical protein
MSDNAVSIFGAHNAADDFAGMRETDKILPRLMLMQYSSRLVKDGKAKAGDYINSASEEVVIPFGQTSLIVPMMFWTEWIEWNPNREDKNKILARSADPNGELAKRSMAREQIQTKQGMRYAVSETYTYLVMAPEIFGNYEDMMLISMARSAWFIGKKWMNRQKCLKYQGCNVPLAGAAWGMAAEKKTKDGDDYMVPTFGEAQVLNPDILALTLPASSKCKQQRDSIMNVSLSTAETEVDHNTVKEEPEF